MDADGADFSFGNGPLARKWKELTAKKNRATKKKHALTSSRF